MTVSRSSTRSTFGAICSGGLFLMALFLGKNHVVDACSCIYQPSPCSAMQARPVLVRATIQNKTEFFDERWGLAPNGVRDPQFITNHYDALVSTVYLNAGAPTMEAGQTIEIRAAVAGNLCGIQLPVGMDMLLDLYPQSNGDYFSTGSCSMNAGIDESGAIMQTDYNECFTYDSLASDTLSFNAMPTLTITEEEFTLEEEVTKEEEVTTEEEIPTKELTKAERRKIRQQKRKARQEARRKARKERQNETI